MATTQKIKPRRVGQFKYEEKSPIYHRNRQITDGPQIGEAYHFENNYLNAMVRKIPKDFEGLTVDSQTYGFTILECAVVISANPTNNTTTVQIYNSDASKRQETLRKLEESFS